MFIIILLCLAIFIFIIYETLIKQPTPEEFKITNTYLNDEGVLLEMDSDSSKTQITFTYDEINKLNDAIAKGNFNS